MERLSKNELFMLVMDLPLANLTNLCRTSKLFNARICANEDFWREKLGKDFPNWYITRDTDTVKNLGSFKNVYIFLHQLIEKDSASFFSKISEKSQEIAKIIVNEIPYLKHDEYYDDSPTSGIAVPFTMSNLPPTNFSAKPSKNKRQKFLSQKIESKEKELYSKIFDLILQVLNLARHGDYYWRLSSEKMEKKLDVSLYDNIWKSFIPQLNQFIYEIYLTHVFGPK